MSPPSISEPTAGTEEQKQRLKAFIRTATAVNKARTAANQARTAARRSISVSPRQRQPQQQQQPPQQPPELTSSDDSDDNDSDDNDSDDNRPLNPHRGAPPEVTPPSGPSNGPHRKSQYTSHHAIPDTSLSEIKSALAELQLKEANRELLELKKKKINETEYIQFAESLNEKGLKLVTDDDKIKTFTGKLRDKNLTELLAGATINYKSPLKQGELLKTIQQRKDIAYKMELRDQIMKDTGREFGPDIALLISLNGFKDDILKADNLKEGETNINSIINENSSITEVLNVLAFLINKKNERVASIISAMSVKGGTHDKNGMYENENEIKSNHNLDHIKTVFNCLNEGVESPFNIETLQPYTPDESTPPPKGKLPPKIILPAGILKRKSDYTTQHFELTPEEIPKLFIACVLQMINLLQTTREVFGNWTKLFKGMNGGGSKSKSKKTRRRNRNRN
jgi:hypothetical protein